MVEQDFKSRQFNNTGDHTGKLCSFYFGFWRNHITVVGSGSETASVTLKITDNAVGLAQMSGINRGSLITGDVQTIHHI